MNSLIASLRDDCLLDHGKQGAAEVPSLITYFADYYRMCHPIENEKIRAGFGCIEPIIKSLSMKRQNRLFHVVSELCEACENQAFHDGFCVGARLVLELLDDCEKSDLTPK